MYSCLHALSRGGADHGRRFLCRLRQGMGFVVLSLLIALPLPAIAQRSGDAAWQRAAEQQARDERDRERRQFEAEMAEFKRRGDAQDRELAAMKQRLQQCGSCAERGALQAEIARVEAGRQEALRTFCASMQALESIHPLLGRLPGGDESPCLDPATAQRRKAEREAKVRERLQIEKRAESGAPADVHALARWMADEEKDPRTACRLWGTVAGRGHAPSTAAFASQCLDADESPRLLRQRQKRLQDCAAAGDADCQTHWQGYLAGQQRRADAERAAVPPGARLTPAPRLSAEEGEARRRAAQRGDQCDRLTQELAAVQRRAADSAPNPRTQSHMERLQGRQASACAQE